MKPSDAVTELRRIAAGIAACKTETRRDLVIRDLRRVLAAIDPAPGVPGILKVLNGALNAVQRPFEEHAMTEMRQFEDKETAFYDDDEELWTVEKGSEFTKPPVSEEDLVSVAELEGGHQIKVEVVMEAEGAYVIVWLLDPGSGEWDAVWEGNEYRIGLTTDEVEDAAQAIHKALLH